MPSRYIYLYQTLLLSLNPLLPVTFACFFEKKISSSFFKKKLKINKKTKGTFTLTTFKVVRVKVILFF